MNRIFNNSAYACTGLFLLVLCMFQLMSFVVNGEFSDVLSIPAEEWKNVIEDSGSGFANDSSYDESNAASSGASAFWSSKCIMVAASLLAAVINV